MVSDEVFDALLEKAAKLEVENRELRQKIDALQQENIDLVDFISKNTTFGSNIAVDWKFDI